MKCLFREISAPTRAPQEEKRLEMESVTMTCSAPSSYYSRELSFFPE